MSIFDVRKMAPRREGGWSRSRSTSSPGLGGTTEAGVEPCLEMDLSMIDNLESRAVTWAQGDKLLLGFHSKIVDCCLRDFCDDFSDSGGDKTAGGVGGVGGMGGRGGMGDTVLTSLSSKEETEEEPSVGARTARQ